MINLGKISDFINQMIGRTLESAEFTSANPTWTNYLIKINDQDSPDFEAEIKRMIDENTGKGSVNVGSESADETEMKKQAKAVESHTKKFKKLDKSHMGEINRMTSNQFGNIRQMATDPTGFLIQTFMKKFARGIGVIAFALIIFEAVKWVISELLKPGRLLDRRFRRTIGDEIMAFRRREEQQKLRQGFSSLIITTEPRLRGGYMQVTNTLDMAGGRMEIPETLGHSPQTIIASGVTTSKNKGNRRFGR